MLLALRTALVACVIGALQAPAFASTLPDADWVIDHVNLVPMTANLVQADRSVVVRGGLIVAIMDAAAAKRVRAAKRIDGRGHYLMPGLSDMHVHLRMPTQDFLDLQLAAGVTTVFNMGLADGGGKVDHLALRAGLAAGRLSGPRYLVSGPQLESGNLKSLEDVQQALQDAAKQRYDAIKIHGDLPADLYDALITGARARGIRVRGHAQHFMPLAQTLRMGCIEHIEELLYTSLDAQFAEAAHFGQEADGSIDHFLTAYTQNLTRLQDASYRARVVQAVAASGVVWDPTLVIYTMLPTYLDDQRFSDLAKDPRLNYLPDSVRLENLSPDRNEYRAELAPKFSKFFASNGDSSGLPAHFDRNVALLLTLIRELHQAGVPLLAGSDAFGALVPGFALHQELALLVKAGLSPFEALTAATATPAKYLGEFDRAGTLEVGKRADFILVGANPLADIQHAADVRGVYTQGRWLSAPDLRARLRRVARHAAAH